jgi:tetratricopeptide (TPR) repeat protein
LVDQDNEPHVTDFGLAKSLLSDMDMTSPSEVVGTPSFIAPEQIKGAEDSKLSDVYSLGATLYALLTGEPPFQGRTPAETLQQVLEGPLRAPRLIDSQVPADLETICLKCMDRHPEYRYRSAAELAAELQRFGIGQSIKARPIGVVGSSIRLARRNPLTTALLSVVSIGLLASPLVAVYLNQQRRLAVQGQERATKAVSELEQVSDFMQSVWHSADPYVNGKDLLASELLDDAIQQANDRFQEDPKIHAEVLLALGSNYHDLGFTDKAVEVLQESVNCYEKSHGPKSQKTLLAQGRLAVSLLYDSKNEQASELIDTATETWLSSYPRDADYDQLEAARITILMEDDEYESAIALRREAIERAIVRDGEDSRKVRAQQLQLAMALIECEEFKKAENLVSNVIQLCDKDQSTKEILYADALGLMGRIRRAEENRTQAIEYQTQALELRVELLGEDHWESLRGMKSLALSMQRAQRLDGMLELLERRAAAAYRRYGPNHRESVSASIDVMLKNPDPAMRVEGYESVLPRMLVAYGEDDRQVLAVKQTAAQAYIFSGKPIEASRILREILPKVIDAFGPYHRNTLRTQLVLATAISEASNVSDSIAFLEDVYESHVQELGPDHASSVDLLCNMANYACRGESFDNAKLWAKKAISICDSLENQPQYSPRRADMQLVLAESNLAEDDNDSTIKNAMTSHDVFSRSGSPNIFLAHAEALMSLASAKAGDANQSRTQAEKAHVTLGNLSENRSDAWRRTRAEELLSLVTDFASATNSQEIENP